jgi:ABC-type phosphate transport system substrate-binding protein
VGVYGDFAEQNNLKRVLAPSHGKLGRSFGPAIRGLVVLGLTVALFVWLGWASTVASIQAQTSSQPLSGKLTVGGSTALQPLVEQAAASFQSTNPGVQIDVSDGGSGSGRTGVCQGTLDVDLSDVTLTAGEKSSLNCADAVETAIAMDAFVVAANPTGPGNVAALDREQMEAIFSGAVKNWAVPTNPSW